jgi:hypothetical protein
MAVLFQSLAPRAAAAPARSPLLPPPHPEAQPSAPLLDLQRTRGNQYVQRLLSARAIQPKLSVSEPGDPLERDADRVADAVMRMPDPARPAIPDVERARGPRIQRMCKECEEEQHGL